MNTYDIALYDTGMLIATVPHKGDIEAAISAEEKNIGEPLDRDRITIVHDLVLTDEVEDGDDIVYSGNSMGWLMDENDRTYNYAVRR